MSAPSAANTPVRSVSTPRVIVLPLMPVPVLTLPPEAPALLVELLDALVLQPVVAARRAAASRTPVRVRFFMRDALVRGGWRVQGRGWVTCVRWVPGGPGG